MTVSYTLPAASRQPCRQAAALRARGSTLSGYNLWGSQATAGWIRRSASPAIRTSRAAGDVTPYPPPAASSLASTWDSDMTNTHRAPAGRRFRRRGALLAGAAALVVAAACSDSNVPFLTAPTSVPATPTGLQQALLGLFSNSRTDMFSVGIDMSAMSREAANFTSTEPRFIRYDTGILPIPVGGWLEIWQFEYQNIPHGTTDPAGHSQGAAGVHGAAGRRPQRAREDDRGIQLPHTAWAHDTTGFVIMQSPTTTTLNPLVCLKDGMAYIAALLDSANADLNTAGATPFPFKLPPASRPSGSLRGPSTAAGSFAAFNRALAARAKLEQAYAAGTKQPTFTDPGSPNTAMLTSADSAMKASALFQPASLPKNAAGGWPYDNFSVMWDFSAQSGDQTNPLNANIGTIAVLSQVPSDQDTVNDLRWKAKFGPNPACTPGCPTWPVQLPGLSEVAPPHSPPVASKDIVTMYPSPGSPLPIIRSETMTLFEAQIRLGLGDIRGRYGLRERRADGGGGSAGADADRLCLRAEPDHEGAGDLDDHGSRCRPTRLHPDVQRGDRGRYDVGARAGLYGGRAHERAPPHLVGVCLTRQRLEPELQVR